MEVKFFGWLTIIGVTALVVTNEERFLVKPFAGFLADKAPVDRRARPIPLACPARAPAAATHAPL